MVNKPSCIGFTKFTGIAIMFFNVAYVNKDKQETLHDYDVTCFGSKEYVRLIEKIHTDSKIFSKEHNCDITVTIRPKEMVFCIAKD